MAKKKYCFDEKKIARFIRERRGKGIGKDYIPWLLVSDVPSDGRSHRLAWAKTGREHQLLSDCEYYTFLRLSWDDNVVDIREQFPLIDRRETLEIAARCGVRHPVDPISGALWVLTTDFLVTYKTDRGERLVAYSVKEEETVNEKFEKKRQFADTSEIERRYWMRRDVPWLLVPGDKVKKGAYSRNLFWIFDADETCYQDVNGADIDAMVLREFVMGKAIHGLMPIRDVCKIIDQRLHFIKGTSLAALRRLLRDKIVLVDLHAKSIQELSLKDFSINGGL